MEIYSNNRISGIGINKINQNAAEENHEAKQFAPSSTAFKSSMTTNVLNKSGSIMNWIENGGFLVLFLIQDFFGMTVPRSIAGFLRDKEVTGRYNMQEGFEVLGREGLTGPCMMAVAPISLYLAAKCGQTTSINSKLIKHYGNSLQEMISEPDFDKNLLKNPEKFKNEFYLRNVRSALENTLGKENVTQESVDYVMTQLKNMENIPKDAKLSKFRGKSKYRAQCMDNIVEYINNLKYTTGSDLELLQKVQLGKNKGENVFKTRNALDGMMKYANDAITANKKLEKLDSVMAESIKHNALGKRVLTTVSMIAATLGVLSVLPKIYARSNVAPGARQNLQKQETNNNQNPTFKGKGNNFIEKLGKAMDKNKSEFVSKELEYNGHNFTHTLMTGLSLFGLLTPRCLRAYNRADTNKDGKKDLTELYEIILRDVTSSLAVVFAVPMLTRAAVTAYEKNSGFVLMQKDRSMGKLKTSIDLLNPYSKAHVLSNAEISALYNNIDSKEKMVNFCKYVEKNGGDLQKILSKSEETKTIFNEKTFTLDSLKNLTKEEKNKKILSFVENIEEEAKKLTKDVDKKTIDKMLTKLMKGGVAGGKANKIAAFARGLNSVPGILTTFLISPYILGWVIPRLTYKNTRRIHEKEDRENMEKEQQKLKTSA